MFICSTVGGDFGSPTPGVLIERCVQLQHVKLTITGKWDWLQALAKPHFSEVLRLGAGGGRTRAGRSFFYSLSSLRRDAPSFD